MKLDRKQLVRTAVRENNTKRPYLLVRSFSGKACSHRATHCLAAFFGACGTGAGAGGNHCPVLIIAFAETATAIGAAVAAKLRNPTVFMQTREKSQTQILIYVFGNAQPCSGTIYDKRRTGTSASMGRACGFCREDEVTTGNTILHLMNVLNERC